MIMMYEKGDRCGQPEKVWCTRTPFHRMTVVSLYICTHDWRMDLTDL